jgi:hypothetical protein
MATAGLFLRLRLREGGDSAALLPLAPPAEEVNALEAGQDAAFLELSAAGPSKTGMSRHEISRANGMGKARKGNEKIGEIAIIFPFFAGGAP